MCRLFGMSAGEEAVRATFWLLGARDSLRDQSHQNADGTGIHQISYNPSNDIDPSLLGNGRIMWSRWDNTPGRTGGSRSETSRTSVLAGTSST